MNRAAFLVLLLLALSGCVTQPWRDGDPATQLTHLLERHEYGEALALIERLPADDSLRSRGGGIRRMARQHEQEAIREARRLEKKEQWRAAIDRCETALEQIPDSAPLQQHLKGLEERRRQRLDELELDMLTARGAWLAEYRNLYIAYEQADPDLFATLSGPSDLEINRIARQLLERGQQALERDDFEEAQRTLPLALRLDRENPQAVQAKGELDKRLKKAAREVRQRRDRQRRSKALQLGEQFDQALIDDELLEAQRIYPELSDYLSTQEADAYRERLEQAVNQRIDFLMNEANSLYGTGHFEAAIERWRSVLVLEPGNKGAADSKARAERVVEKLHELQQRQP